MCNTIELHTTPNPLASRKRLCRLSHILMAHLAATFVIVGSIAFGTPLAAQSAGIDRALVVKQLREKHLEIPVGRGLATNGGIIELFSSPDGATWTLILTMPNGKSVMLGAGENWASAPVITTGRKI